MTSITSMSFVKIPAPNFMPTPSTTVRPMPRTMLSCKYTRCRNNNLAFIILGECACKNCLPSDGKSISKKRCGEPELAADLEGRHDGRSMASG
ncbi:Os03g0216733 [Oryza sativa Japonica Group]|uniref:Os03g0216733 protein n=1 Tax=Oryza sativa subsp. japonica TaxID=39947 RepID=A0A0P0VUR5_ORYSJ|nr:hypothetical protein EE612_016134 [Oryza sativa]BAS82978.1 Os03g0216733 [Oryza sativa Japonica Group]